MADKAKTIFEDLKYKEGGEETFLGSKRWPMKFNNRTECRVKWYGTVASTETATAAAYPNAFPDYIEKGILLIFNIDESRFY